MLEVIDKIGIKSENPEIMALVDLNWKDFWGIGYPNFRSFQFEKDEGFYFKKSNTFLEKNVLIFIQNVMYSPPYIHHLQVEHIGYGLVFNSEVKIWDDSLKKYPDLDAFLKSTEFYECKKNFKYDFWYGCVAHKTIYTQSITELEDHIFTHGLQYTGRAFILKNLVETIEKTESIRTALDSCCTCHPSAEMKEIIKSLEKNVRNWNSLT